MPRSPLVLAAAAGFSLFACADSSRRLRLPDAFQSSIALQMPRRFVARLSVPTTYRACEPSADTAETLDWRCQAEPGDDLPSSALLASMSGAHAVIKDSVERLYFAAIIDLTWHDSAGNSIDRSISSLNALSHLDAKLAAPIVDQSAAHLLLAAQRGAPWELLAALDDANRAMLIDSSNAAAAFNRALALDMLGAVDQASAAWRRYLALDHESGWATEARGRLQALAHLRVDAVSPAIDAPDSAFANLAGRAPAEARVTGWEKLLGAWGRAVLASKRDTASNALRRATAIATALSDAHGDRTLAGAIDVIRATDNASQRRYLAQAHALYASAQDRYRHAGYDDADSLFALIEKVAPSNARDLRAWARVGRAATRTYLHHIEQGEAFARQAVAAADSLRLPALFGFAHWRYGAILARRASYDRGLEALASAQQAFMRIGERENVAAVEGVIGNVLASIGNQEDATAAVWRAVRATRSTAGSLWRHNALVELIRTATAEHLAGAAAALASEDVAVAAANGTQTYIVESNIVAAEAARTLDDTAAASRFAAQARAALDRHEPGTIRDDLRAQLQTTAALLARTRPEVAIALADSGIAFFAPTHNPFRLVPLFIARGDALRALGQLTAAEGSYRLASVEVERQRGGLSKPAERAALRAVRREVLDRLVMLLVGTQRAAAAFALVEDRSSTTRADATGATIAYALVGDTLLAWVKRDGRITLERGVTSHERFGATIARVNARLALNVADAQLERDLGWLYDLLIAPSAARLPPEGAELTIAADGDIANVPFAALYDASRRSYLVARYALTYASRFRDGSQRASSAVSAVPTTPVSLFFAASAPSVRSVTLARLDQASSEVQTASRLYRDALTRIDAEADSASLVDLLPRASLFHFAGHAVFDYVNPERSFLALSSGSVTARTLSALDLTSLRLVVLSACDATRSGASHNAGLLGIADAFLAAGARGVVGPNWQVTDSTAVELTLAFHRAYAAHLLPAAALRKAQLELATSKRGALASPASWAAFRYIAGSIN